MSFLNAFYNTVPECDSVAVCWLGQAGFLIKDHMQHVVAVDPYLSNCGEKMRGFKRLTPMLISPEEVSADYYITTHAHFDHFDYEAIPVIHEQIEKTVFLGPSSCREQFQKLHLDDRRFRLLDRGMTLCVPDIRFCAVEADHGDMAPDAIGLILEMGGCRLYFSGDTAFSEERFAQLRDERFDAAFLSINGKFGNMDAVQGARAAEILNACAVVPCHCWTFAEHGGDPGAFAALVKAQSNGNPFLFRYGETKIFVGRGQ